MAYGNCLKSCWMALKTFCKLAPALIFAGLDGSPNSRPLGRSAALRTARERALGCTSGGPVERGVASPGFEL